MPGGVPAGLLALAGSGQLGQVPLGRQPTFQSALTGSLGLLGQARGDQQQSSDRQFQEMLQIAEMEQQIRQAEAQQAQAQQQQAAQQAYVQSLPQGQQALGTFAPDVLAKEQAKSAFPDPTGRFKVVGTDLFDVSGAQPQLAARGRRASEPLVPVYDPATGTTTYQQRGAAAGKMPPPASGMEIVTDPETGQTTVRTNVQGGGEVGTKGRATIENQMIALTGARERLGNIASAWQPEFSTLQKRVGMWGQELRDKVGLLPEDQQGELAAYSDYQQNTLSNLNRTIKDITGAAMSIPEAARIMKEVPNLEDGPTKFKAKLDNAVNLTNLAYARLSYLHSQGLPAGQNYGGIGLEQMPQLMDDFGEKMEANLVQQGFDPAAAEQQALIQVRQAFGL